MNAVSAMGNTGDLKVMNMTGRMEVKENGSFERMFSDHMKDTATLPGFPVTPECSTYQVHEDKMTSGNLREKLETTKEPEETGRGDDCRKTKELESCVKDEIKEKLGVTQEELEEAMAELGLTDADLLIPQNVRTLCLSLNDSEEVDLLTDGELFAAIDDILKELNGLLEQAGAESGMTVSEFTEMALAESQPSDIPKEEKVENGEMLSGETEDMPEQESELTVVKQTGEAENQFDETKDEEHAPGMVDHTPVIQDNQNVETPVATQGTTGFSTTTATDAVNQMIEAMKLDITPEVTELKLQLHPESLGNVHVQLTAKEGMITASFTAQNEAVKNALESQMIQLKATLEEKGIQVEAVEVKVDAGAYNEQYQDAKDNEQQEAFERELRKNHPRRINLMDYAEGENGELNEEEELAVKMMRENGNSLDYSA